jgi:hypothetical protein
VHDEAKKKEEEKDCVIIFRLSELSLIPWTAAKSLVHLHTFAENLH